MKTKLKKLLPRIDWTANKIWLIALTVIIMATSLGVSAVGDPVVQGGTYTSGHLPVIDTDNVSLVDGPSYDTATGLLTVDSISASSYIGLTGSGIVGVEWDQNTDDWRHIDELGNTVSPASTYFDLHAVWGGMRRCTVESDGTVHYGSNPRGDGLDLTGATGQVMVEIPKFYVKSQSPAANTYRWWVAPEATAGYELHPAFVQRGGVAQDYIYVGAYAAGFAYNGDDAAYDSGNEILTSVTGVQPYTGNKDCFWVVDFDGGTNAPTIGDEVSTSSEGGFFVVDYLKTAGAWDGSAEGKLWLRKPGDSSCGFGNDENIDNNSASVVLGVVNGAVSGKSVTLANCRTLAGNIGSGWGVENIWTLSALQLLFYTEYAGADSQTLVGKGIVDKDLGVGFVGEINGFDSADTNIGVNGTGMGTGTNGLTPVVWRGIENLWGNVNQWIDGFNAVDAEYRIIKADGTGTFADTLTDYDASLAAPITDDGYISNIVYEDVLKYLFFASAVAGASNNGLHDQWYAHDAGEINVLSASGNWHDGAGAGVALLSANSVASAATRALGARVEFIPQS